MSEYVQSSQDTSTQTGTLAQTPYLSNMLTQIPEKS